MPTLTTDFLARELRAEMARQGLTQGDVAERTKGALSAVAISRRFAGKVTLSTADLLTLCAALGVPLATIAARAEERAA